MYRVSCSGAVALLHVGVPRSAFGWTWQVSAPVTPVGAYEWACLRLTACAWLPGQEAWAVAAAAAVVAQAPMPLSTSQKTTASTTPTPRCFAAADQD